MDTKNAELITPTNPTGTTRRVLTFEIIKHAKRYCSLCHGAGQYNVTFEPSEPSVERVCGCALRRFLKLFEKSLHVTSEGQLYWLEGKDPAQAEIEVAKQLSKTDSNDPNPAGNK